MYDKPNPVLTMPTIKGYNEGGFDLKELVKNHAVKLLCSRGTALKGKDKIPIEEAEEMVKVIEKEQEKRMMEEDYFMFKDKGGNV